MLSGHISWCDVLTSPRPVMMRGLGPGGRHVLSGRLRPRRNKEEKEAVEQRVQELATEVAKAKEEKEVLEADVGIAPGEPGQKV